MTFQVLIPEKYNLKNIDITAIILNEMGPVNVLLRGRVVEIDVTPTTAQRNAIKTAFLATVTTVPSIDE